MLHNAQERQHRNSDGAGSGEHSNPITTVKPDVIVILRADQGIVMENGSKQSTRMYS